MSQTLRQCFVAAIQTRRHGALRTTQNIRDLLVRKTLDVFEQDWQTQFRFQLGDSRPYRVGNLAASEMLLWRGAVRCFRHLSCIAKWKKASALSLFVDAGVDHQPVEPCRKLRIAAKLA